MKGDFNMNKRNKTLTFLVLFLVAFGMSFAVGMTNMVGVDNAVIQVPDGGQFLLATDGDSALDAVSATANNMTGLPQGDDLFAGAYEEYTVIVNASDADGFADIDYILISLVTGAGANVSTIQFTGSTGLFTEVVGASYIRLGSATNVSGTNDVDLTVPFAIEWEMGAQTDLDLNITVIDATQGDTESINLNLDVIATLTLSDSTLFTYAEYLNGEHFGTMQLTYHYTGYTTTYPTAAETDFWITRSAIVSEQVGSRSWEASSYADATGIATWSNVLAPEVNEEVTLTMSLFAVDQAGGASDTSLMSTTYTDTTQINPNAPLPEDREPRDGIVPVIPNIFGTMEGAILVGVAAVVVMGTGLYISKKGTTSKRTRKSTRKSTRKKRKKKAKRRRR
jgi:hypothetical protein